MSRRQDRLVTAALVVLILAVLMWAARSSYGAETRLGRWSPGYGNARNAIYFEFCGHHYRYCEAGDEAMRVANCETGGTFSVWARNGQYVGLFQMGTHERATYGDRRDPWGEAGAAYRYWIATGKTWSPWTCKP